MSRATSKSNLAIAALAVLRSTCLVSSDAAARGHARIRSATVHAVAHPVRVSRAVIVRPATIRTVASAIQHGHVRASANVSVPIGVATATHAPLNGGHTSPGTNLVQHGNISLRPLTPLATAGTHLALPAALTRPTLATNATSLHTDVLNTARGGSKLLNSSEASFVLKNTAGTNGKVYSPVLARLYQAKADRQQAAADQQQAQADETRALALLRSGDRLMQLGRELGNLRLVAEGFQQKEQAGLLRAQAQQLLRQARLLDLQANALDGQ